jgi:hypothetical protein
VIAMSGAYESGDHVPRRRDCRCLLCRGASPSSGPRSHCRGHDREQNRAGNEPSPAGEIQETPCLFCRAPVRYIISFSLSVASPDAHTVESVDAVYPPSRRYVSATLFALRHSHGEGSEPG